jgi:hypothetical protein
MISIVVAIVVLLIIILSLALFRRSPVGGPIPLSHLKCPKCGTEFDYAYLPEHHSLLSGLEVQGF